MSLTRRTAIGLAAAGGLLAADVKPKPGQPASPKRRLLFNWDGSVIHCWGKTTIPNANGPLTRAQFTSLAFTPLENAGVDTVLFSFGSGNVAEYQSNVLEWPGQADEFEFPKSRTWHGGGLEFDPKDQYLNPKSMADAGHNPPLVVVEECHKRGLTAFVSLRMNDTHDGQHTRGTLPNPELPTFKRLNPDWLVENLDRWSALDYRRPQVRAWKLKIIEEYFDRWDFDGIELDWLRHTLNFARGTEKESAKYLTEFMRSVRKSLQARAAKRGRPIEIAVRVPEQMEWCLLGGYDVPAWISEDLIDMLILGQGLTDLPSLQEFRAVMKGRSLPIYPCLYPYGNGYAVSPDEVIRASAANLWRGGADGIYTFNWHHYGTWRQSILSEIGNPQKLARKNKHYVLTHRFDAGRSAGTDYLRFNTPYRDRNALVPFELNVADGLKSVALSVAEIPAKAELWISLEHSEPGDALTVMVNGKALELAGAPVDGRWQTIGYEVHLPPGNGTIGLPATNKVDMRFSGLRWQLPANVVVAGSNTVSIRLDKRGKGAEFLLKVERVELFASAV